MGSSSAWRGSESSSSMKLLLLMVPLILVAGLISVLGPNPSSWMKQPLLLNSVSSSTSITGAVTTPSEVNKREGLVVVAVDTHAGENVISDDTDFNHSSTPPFSVQAIPTPQQSVRAFFFLFLF